MGIFVNTAGSTAYLRRVTNLNYNAAVPRECESPFPPLLAPMTVVPFVNRKSTSSAVPVGPPSLLNHRQSIVTPVARSPAQVLRDSGSSHEDVDQTGGLNVIP